MIDLLGIRLALQLGPNIPVPAPFVVMDALRSIEVRMDYSGRDGFQLSLAIDRDTPFDPSLIASGLFEPGHRVVLSLMMGALPEVLIDGVITDLQYHPSPQPGESMLHVTGEDLSVMMDLEEQSAAFEGRCDSAVVTELLAPFMSRYRLIPAITQTADWPLPSDRTPTQQGTTLAHIRHLAERNGFVFFVEPVGPGVSRAYWGPDVPSGMQPAIQLGPDSHRPTEGGLQGRFEALGPTAPVVTITEPITGTQIPIPIPPLAAVPPTLRAVTPLRRPIARRAAGLGPLQAALAGLAAASRGSEAVHVSGELDGVRYGAVLRSRRLVGLRGTGMTWDGPYAVEQVTHHLQRGEYRQSFTLKRSGFVSPTPAVLP